MDHSQGGSNQQKKRTLDLENTNPEKLSSTVFDLQICDVRTRGSDIEKIIDEMSVEQRTSRFDQGNLKTDDKMANAEDELLGLIDNEL